MIVEENPGGRRGVIVIGRGDKSPGLGIGFTFAFVKSCN